MRNIAPRRVLYMDAMKALLSLLLCASCVAAAQQRPKITGIDHVDFYTTHPQDNAQLYIKVLGLTAADPIEPKQTQRYWVGRQWVGYSPAPDPNATDRMDHLAFATTDAEALRKYLASKGQQVPGAVTRNQDGSSSFQMDDPEHHRIEFVQPAAAGKTKEPDAVSRRLIHAGFIVHDRAAEDRFYKDILGFRLYWHGGMDPARTDWVAMQTPDGTDWLEYMLNQSAHPDLRTTGVMNHISLGVVDMTAAQRTLEAHGWHPHDDEHRQMGKDGKVQLNLFDPDFSRIELMEFRPTEKPCCADFTGPHPSESK